MEYESFYESVEKDENGKYYIDVKYSRKGVDFVEKAEVDGASEAHKKLLQFRAEFKTKLVELGLAKKKLT